MTGIRTQPVCRVTGFSLCGCSSLTVSVVLFQKFLACSSVEKILVHCQRGSISLLCHFLCLLLGLRPRLSLYIHTRGETVQSASGMRRFCFSSSSPRGHLITRYPPAKVPILQQLRISAACFRSVRTLSSNLIILFSQQSRPTWRNISFRHDEQAVFWTCSLGRRGMDDIALYDHQGAHILGWVGT